MTTQNMSFLWRNRKTCPRIIIKRRCASIEYPENMFYASTQSVRDLHCPLTELLDTTECMKAEQRPG